MYEAPTVCYMHGPHREQDNFQAFMMERTCDEAYNQLKESSQLLSLISFAKSSPKGFSPISYNDYVLLS